VDSHLSVDKGFRVEVQGDHIVVTFIGTSLCVDYPKPKKGKALSPSGLSKPAGATSAQVAAFLSVANTLANERAKKLGWVSYIRFWHQADVCDTSPYVSF
jgi:hypothetical protein